jgi:hypothetical protein
MFDGTYFAHLRVECVATVWTVKFDDADSTGSDSDFDSLKSRRRHVNPIQSEWES